MVLFGKVGAVLPDGMALERVKLKGVESLGMICSPANLNLGDTADEPFDASAFGVGDTLAQVLGAERPSGVEQDGSEVEESFELRHRSE